MSQTEREASVAAEQFGSARTYRVTHRVVAYTGGRPFSLLEMWLPLPLADAVVCPEQTVASLQLTPRARIAREADKLARVAAHSFSSNEAGRSSGEYSLRASYEITIRSRLFDEELHDRHSSHLTQREIKYRKGSQYKLFTRPEKKVPVGDDSIKSLANRIGRDGAAPYATARAFYEWIIDNIEYRECETFGGAAVCLQERYGECCDFSALFVALCRTAGIPARPVVGYWAERRNGWHCWAEFMLPEGRWLPVDCQMGGRGIFARNRYFAQSDNRRAALCKTFDVTIVNADGENRKADYLQDGRFWWRTKKKLAESDHPKVVFEVKGEVV